MMGQSSTLSSTANPVSLTAVSLVVVLCAPGSGAHEWRVETVDSAGCGYTSMVLDEQGLPHIGYCDVINWDLKYAHKDSLGWHIETVDAGGHVGGYPSLALDGSAYPHLGYYDSSPNYDLKYAYRDPSGWHVETVDSVGDVGGYTSLRLDEGCSPCISYCDWGNDDLKYGYRDGSVWYVETVDAEGDVGRYTSLALDALGRPHISYFSATYEDLKYAHRHACGWQLETVDWVGGVGYYTSLALDRWGYPHISYKGEGLEHAYCDTSGWHTETVDGGGNCTSLAMDRSGRPHISYQRYGFPDSELRYACRYASGWHTETVDTGWQVGWHTSLMLDDRGLPHISYVADGDLKYAYATGEVAVEGLPGSGVVRALRLVKVTPNPASSEALILYCLADGAEALSGGVSLRICDPCGRLVAAPTLEPALPGTRSFRWNLRATSGSPAPPGVYYARLEAEGQPAAEVTRLLVVR